MKSRYLLPFNLPTPHRSSPGDSVLVRPRAQNATASAARRFELQHNTSPRFARRRQARRQGQALLLAVLIMLLAALLSAGFLAVVSGNLNQSARIADKTRAIEASRAGIAYANAQLSGSANGDLWRPTEVSPAPAPGSANYDFYYSQLDKVQGWANTRAQNDPLYRDTAYGKFPAPDQPIGDAPKFLVRVEELPTNLTPSDADYEHRGEIKITSIGLSDDDPNVFHRAVAYKTGRTQSPWGEAFRSVSNWDFKNNEVPMTRLATNTTILPIAGAVTNSQIQISDPLADKEELPFNIVIGGRTGGVTLGATVRDMDASGKTLTIDSYYLPNNNTIPVGLQGGEMVTLAAAVGTPATIDLFNVGGTPATDFPDQDQPNGLRVNGSVWLQGHLQLTALQKNGTKIFNSAYLATSNYSPNASTSTLQVTPSSNLPNDIANGGSILPSSSTNYPGLFTAKTGVKKLDLVRDGADRLNNPNVLGLTYTNTAPNAVARDVEPFKPADISSPENVARFRSLARASEGVYIDNNEDFEKTGSAPMSQAQLMKMWLSPVETGTTAPPIFSRRALVTPSAGETAAPAPAAVNSPTASLEDQHLRGWIAPDEFLARGVLVQLVAATIADPGPNFPNPFLRVTLDSRGDNTATDIRRATGALDSKRWPDFANRPTVNTYVKEFRWPTNGTLFAEGNIRIRGQVTNAPNSLTVVSQGNIYIEGSVGVGTPYAYDPNLTDVVNDNVNKDKKKLMLLARKNVIVNPTRVALGHVEVQTKTVSTPNAPFAARTTRNLVVATNNGFKIGDVIETSSFAIQNDGTYTLTPGIRGVITDLGFNQITVYVLQGARVPSGSTVSTITKDERANDANSPKTLLVNSTTAFSRRVLLPNAASGSLPTRLTLDHFGEQKEGIKVTTVADPTKPDDLEVYVTNKRTPTFVATLFLVEPTDKFVSNEYSAPTGSPDIFPTPPTQPFSLADLETAMDAKTHPVLPPVPGDPRGWKYDTSVAAAVQPLPFHYLAGVGLRYSPDNAEFPSMDATDPNTWRSEDIGADGEEFSIPLATSIQVLRGGQAATLVPQNAFVAGTATKQFGFNPNYAVSLPDLAQEDRLTVDQSFYLKNDATLNEKSRYSTLDSRGLHNGLTTNLTNGEVLTFEQDKFPTGNIAAALDELPDYRVKAMKLEKTSLGIPPSQVSPVALTINAFVYAQEGRWFIIPGDYFRGDSPVRPLVSNTNQILATYIDYDNDSQPDSGEYIDVDNTNTFTPNDFADLNRNGARDIGEMDAVLRLLRYNHKIKFTGAIVENKTAPVTGAVSEWLDKWAVYRRDSSGETQLFSFIDYAYDPSIGKNYTGARELRIPQTDDLIYQQ